MKHIFRSLWPIIPMLCLSLLVVGCSDKGTKTAPPESDVEASVKGAIPPFLVLTDFEVEPISTGPETTKVNFKATVSPGEDLFLVDRVLEGDPTLTILKQVQAQKAELKLYGSVSATRTLDNWRLADPEITDGLGQFGKPRGSFDARALIEGTPEVNAEIQARAEKKKVMEEKKKAPLESDVKAAVKAAIPSFLVLTDFEIEPISTGPETTKVNFKATVSPEEDLFLADRVLEGDPKVTVLKQVQTQKAKSKLYGTVSAIRTIDNWKLAGAEITDGLSQFGKPRGSFDARALIDGSPELTAEIQARAEKIKADEQKHMAEMQEIGEAREAHEEQMRLEEEAKRKLLTDATAVGRKYEGFLIANEQLRQPIHLVFTEKKGFLIRAEARNPNVKEDIQTFSGEIVFDPKPENLRNDGMTFSIVLVPDGKKPRSGDRWEFYQQEGVLKLNPTNEGLEGEASIGYRYQIKLQKDK